MGESSSFLPNYLSPSDESEIKTVCQLLWGTAQHNTVFQRLQFFLVWLGAT
jgi:hypothetical protein